MAFVAAHAEQINVYLAEKAKLWEEAEKSDPPEFLERVRAYRERAGLKSA